MKGGINKGENIYRKSQVTCLKHTIGPENTGYREDGDFYVPVTVPQ